MPDSAADTLAEPSPDKPRRPQAFVEEDLSAREIAGCQLVRKLGQGAMGAVYLATQLSLRRTVAFKVLDPKFSRDLTYIERFEREAQAAARLTHFNIVQVYDYGREDDLYYIVNEYVDGGTVQDLIDAEGALPLETAIDLMLQTCRGLTVAQESGIMHRDIKPENLMLTRDRVIKIADFGLAKVVDDNATVTQSGMIVGTPFYMSPEQAKGLILDSRSDIYSLGITFFHMITGQLPFDADSVIGVLLKQISAERPDPVAINPSLPNAVGPLTIKMIARDPHERYQTFREVITALEQLAAKLREAPEPAAEAAAPKPVELPSDRAARYKMLPASRILFLGRRTTTPEVAAKMLELVKGDAGVFLPVAETAPERSIVEVRFSVPGRDEIFQSLGVVRWLSQDRNHPGMGVTFLKVSALPRAAAASPSSRRPPTQPAAASVAEVPAVEVLTPQEAIKQLTKNPLHCRLLRYVYANSGQSVDANKIASALGVGNRMLAAVFVIFERCGLIRRHRSGVIDLLWPEDEALQREIVAWVSKYGLL